tara:strand:+ start:11348 stop:11902 length:555 start_codon:yes stop_codon:yes gene_type:complete
MTDAATPVNNELKGTAEGIDITELNDQELDLLVHKARRLRDLRYSQSAESIASEKWDELYADAKKIYRGIVREKMVLDARVTGSVVIHWIGRCIDGEGAEREEAQVAIYRPEVDVLTLESAELLNRIPRLKPKFEECRAEIKKLHDKVKTLCENHPNPEKLEKFVWSRINGECENYHPEYVEDE